MAFRMTTINDNLRIGRRSDGRFNLELDGDVPVEINLSDEDARGISEFVRFHHWLDEVKPIARRLIDADMEATDRVFNFSDPVWRENFDAGDTPEQAAHEHVAHLY